jgi:hypothetical protein
MLGTSLGIPEKITGAISEHTCQDSAWKTSASS